MKNVIIIGSGISGLSTGVLLSSLGYKVKIFEAKPHLGGRAYSFLDRTSNEIIDNGQHILLGCYNYTFKFLKEIGAFDKLTFQSRLHLTFIDSENNTFILDCPKIPAPFHALFGLQKMNILSKKDIINLLRLSKNIYLSNLFKQTFNYNVTKLLKDCNQSDKMVSNFWEPLTISAMNGRPAQISSNLFLKVIYEIFFKSNKNSVIVLPNTHLSELYVINSKNYILERKGEIHLNAPVVDFELNNNRINKIRLKNGKTISGDIFISSIPYFNLLKFNKLIDKLDLHDITKLISSPIISIYLWLDSEITKEHMVMLLKMHSQVLFNKSRIYKIDNNKHLISITISNANDLINCDKMDILIFIIKELKKLFKEEKVFNLQKYKVIKERTATLLITPDTEKFRPAQKTKVDNFFLIGDWINTGLPATLESAVKSSYKLLQLM